MRATRSRQAESRDAGCFLPARTFLSKATNLGRVDIGRSVLTS